MAKMREGPAKNSLKQKALRVLKQRKQWAMENNIHFIKNDIIFDFKTFHPWFVGLFPNDPSLIIGNIVYSILCLQWHVDRDFNVQFPDNFKDLGEWVSVGFS